MTPQKKLIGPQFPIDLRSMQDYSSGSIHSQPKERASGLDRTD